MINRFRISSNLRVRLEHHGVNPAGVLRRAGLPPDLFEQSRASISTDAVFSLWRAIEDAQPTPAIGLQLGSESRTEHFPASILAALTAPDFGTAVDHLARYKRLTCPEEITQTLREREWKIRFRWLAASGEEPDALLDCSFAWILTIGQRGIGQSIAPLRLELRRQRSHTRVLERHFGCPVHCGVRANGLVFRATDARLPFVTRNAELQAILAPHFEQELQHGTGEGGVVELVRETIRERLSARKPAIEDVARELHQSSRTLQRRLRSAGVSFQRLVDESRHRLARQYLASSALDLNEIAFLLGYENVNSFVRAFREWEGTPPGQWRRTAIKFRSAAS